MACRRSAVTSREQVEQTFERLRTSANATAQAAGAFLAERVDSTSSLFLARSAEGESTLVVASVGGSPIAPLRLAGLYADYGVDCTLIEPGQSTSLRATVIRNPRAASASADLFAALCASLIHVLPPNPTDEDVATEISRWSRLFWRLAQPATPELLGLAGELVVIAESNDIERWVSAWHRSPNDRFDFFFHRRDIAVEVKATSRDRRLHEISLSQIATVGEDGRFFVSLRIVQGATPLGELVRTISERLSDSAVIAFWDVLTQTCGAGLDEALKFSVDHSIARSTLRYYYASTVPRPEVSMPLPVGVTNVRFTSDLDLCQAIPPGVVVDAVHGETH